MIIIKNKTAIQKMRTAGKFLAQIMKDVESSIVYGKSTLEIDSFIEKQMLKIGLKPVCKGYAGYKFATCISLNDVIIHGIPSKDVILKTGDLVKIDVVGSFDGYCADITRYFFVEPVKELAKKISLVAQIALDKAIDKAVAGNRIADLSACIQKEVESNSFNVVRKFVGHGIGKSIHEDPNVPNFVNGERDVILREGMTLAIEPMITQGSFEVKIMEDGWTAKTLDGGLAAHVEDTILITNDGPEVLTRL